MTASPIRSPSPRGLATDVPVAGRIVPARSGEDGPAAFAEERRRLRAAQTTDTKRRRIGWRFGLAVDLVLLSLPIPAVIVIPPLLECRHRANFVGFFAGDSFEACARRRVVARWAHLDARIKMIVRNSGR